MMYQNRGGTETEWKQIYKTWEIKRINLRAKANIQKEAWGRAWRDAQKCKFFFHFPISERVLAHALSCVTCIIYWFLIISMKCHWARGYGIIKKERVFARISRQERVRTSKLVSTFLHL